MKINKFIVSICILALVSVFLVVSIINRNSSQNQPVNNKTIDINQSNQLSVDEEYPEKIYELESIQKVQEKLKFKPKLPIFIPKGLKRIYASNNEPIAWVKLFYGDSPSYISLRIQKDIPKSLVDGKRDNYFDEFIKLEPGFLRYVDINGINGVGGEPRNKTLETGQEIFEPGVVVWLEGYNEYELLSYDSNISLEALLKVARSMK